MKQLLNFISKLFLPCVLLGLLQGCGGSGNNTPQYTISASVNQISFSNELFQPSTKTVDITVNFKGNGLLVGYAPDAQPANWLNFKTTNLTKTSATISVNLVNAEFLAANNYSTTLRLSTGDLTTPNLVNVDINVAFLVWQLDTNTNLVSFGDTFGVSTIPSQTVQLTSVDNQWLASVDADWLSIDKSSGTGADNIVITPNISNLDHAGLYKANLTLTEKTSGDTKVIPIELGLDNIYLYANYPSVALVSTANKQSIERIINIKTNSLTPLAWQATTDASWLTLVPMPDTNQLKIIADPTQAPINAETAANIVLSATGNNTVINGSVHVDLYRTDQPTSDQQITDLVVNTSALVASPSRPLIYLGVNNELRVYQQYTGALIAQVPVSPDGSLLEQFLVQPNGQVLLAQASVTTVDAQGVQTSVVHRYKIKLDDLTVTEITDATIEYDPVRFVQFSGRDFVVTHALEYADANLQRLAWQPSTAYFTRTVKQASDNDVLFAIDDANEEFKRYTSKVNDFTTIKLATELTNTYRPESLASGDNIFSFIVDSTGSNLYLHSPTSEWLSFDGSSFVDHGLLEADPNIVTLGLADNSHGQADFVRFDPTQGFRLDVYDQQQTRTSIIPTGTLQPSTTVISSDSQRIISYSSNAKTLSLLDFTN